MSGSFLAGPPRKAEQGGKEGDLDEIDEINETNEPNENDV